MKTVSQSHNDTNAKIHTYIYTYLMDKTLRLRFTEIFPKRIFDVQLTLVDQLRDQLQLLDSPLVTASLPIPELLAQVSYQQIRRLNIEHHLDLLSSGSN